MKRHLLSTLALLVLSVSPSPAATPWSIHEWGTFTSLQDEAGKSIGGINTDDEPAPSFVHSISRDLLIPPTDEPPSFFQGAPSCHPDVTMRLETPVLYVHGRSPQDQAFDVEVQFRGGWLSQYYPAAKVSAPGVDPDSRDFGRLATFTVGSLRWSGLQLDRSAVGPETAQRVWLAPRAVEAERIKTPEGEAEQFLFYRGVAHLDAPLSVSRQDGATTLEIATQSSFFPTLESFPEMWLVDIQSEGLAAWRAIRGEARPRMKTEAGFRPEDYRPDAVAALRSTMHEALEQQGLNADEATALLNTWEISYFKSPGLRLFFLVPPAWTESTLPLKVSGHPEITRVMVGRIELVTPHLRELLAKVAEGPTPDPWKDLREPVDALTWKRGDSKAFNQLGEGEIGFAAIGFKPPAVYQAYLDLGRFRNALVLDEVQRRPTQELQRFITGFQLGAYQPAP